MNSVLAIDVVDHKAKDMSWYDHPEYLKEEAGPVIVACVELSIGNDVEPIVVQDFFRVSAMKDIDLVQSAAVTLYISVTFFHDVLVEQKYVALD